MENLLNDARKFEKKNLTNDRILNFAVNQGKRVDNILKNLLRLIAYLKKQGDFQNYLGPDQVYCMDLVKFTKTSSIIFRHFALFYQQLILLPTNQQIIKSLTSNEYTIKESFAFAEEIVKQDPDFLWEAQMLILFLITSHLKKLLTSALIHSLKIRKKQKVYQKQNLKNVYVLNTKESHFIFDETPYKQNDEVALYSSLGLTLTNAILVHFEKNWLKNCPSDFKQPLLPAVC